MIEERYFEYKKEKKIIDYADIVSDKRFEDALFMIEERYFEYRH